MVAPITRLRPRSAHYYRFRTRWLVPGNTAEVADVLFDPADLVRWWPSVYLAVRRITPGAPSGVGARYDLHTTGWLPYQLRWRMHVTRREARRTLFTATGDLAGRGEIRLRQRGPDVEVNFDWRVRANKPLLRHVSPVLKPIFAANHRWAMARGERSLLLELERRRARNADELARVPAPPRRTPIGIMPFAVSAGAIAGLLLTLWAFRRR
ncbi:hypothetical protein GCM10012275_17830 [Longimycelium tulufanense]|uniref:Polyketide cyclase n=1 Tax=Longimycelium tulufanense TaxID=907463 RepID=A0A8J3FVS9_9PSEU|nr:hypothetical protein [Longimycelium tulufanense]GGM47189.1 hypothetical protein GCM10012275_17830 [Longimycelium tulufanense]